MYTKLSQMFTSEGLEKGVMAAQLWPALILGGIRREVLKQVFGASNMNRVPPLERAARYGEFPDLGIFTVGDWAEAPRYRAAAAGQWVAIDWERVTRAGFSQLLMPGNMPSVALMCWGLVREAMFRRFPPLAELLERELVQACALYYSIPYNMYRYPLLSSHEQELRDRLLDAFFKNKYVARSIRRNFRDNFSYQSTDAGRLGEVVRNQMHVLYPPDPKGYSASHYLSVMSIACTRDIGRKVLPPLVIKGYEKDPFLNFPIKRNPQFYELGHIFSLGTSTVDGVWRYTDFTHPLRPVKYLVVHMGRYAEYRTRGGCDFYLQQLKAHNIPASAILVSGVHFVDWFRTKYPRLDINFDYTHVCSIAEEREIFDLPSINENDLWAVPQSEVQKLLIHARDGAHRLAEYREDPSYRPKTVGKKAVSPMSKMFWVESPIFDDRGHTTLIAQVLSWYGKLYFSFRDYELPPDQTQRMSQRGRCILHEGVFTHPDLDTQFYTLKFLSKAKLGGIVPGTQSYEWLSTFKYMTKKQLRDYMKNSRETVEKWERKGQHQEYNSIPFSDLEASYIIDNYRPNMTKQEVNNLMERLPGRKWSSVVRKAANLCKEMIENGVVDYKLLPHRRPTMAMRKLIKKKKAEMSRDIPVMKVE